MQVFYIYYEVLDNMVYMKTKALNIQNGDRIIAYFKNKMQVCTVKQISTRDLPNIKLSVFQGERYRHSSAGTIQFKSETLVDLIEQKSPICRS